MCLWPPVATESPGIWIKVCRILRLSHSPPPPAHALSRHHCPHHILLPHTTTTHHILLHATTHNHQQQQHPAILVSLFALPIMVSPGWGPNYTKLWLGHFLPPRHFPSVNTFSAWSPCKEGQERGGGDGGEGRWGKLLEFHWVLSAVQVSLHLE